MLSKKIKSIGVLLATLTAFVPAAHADEVGLLAVYKPAGERDFNALENMGCEVWRTGEVGSFRGAYDIKGATHFSLVECQGSILEKQPTRDQLKTALGFQDGGIILEGEYLLKEAEYTPNPKALGRRYVIKIGRFNNNDVDARQSEAVEFFKYVGVSENLFTVEAKFLTSRAIGTRTPDTVEVFYYTTPETAANFVKDIPDLRKRSDIYNSAHFDEYIYFGGVPKAFHSASSQKKGAR